MSNHLSQPATSNINQACANSTDTQRTGITLPAPAKSPITTHVLDLESGTPAASMRVRLFNGERDIAVASTNSDGRILHWPQNFSLSDGQWSLVFDTQGWYSDRTLPAFFPEVRLTFLVDAGQPHYHIPLLLNRFGFSTYRGS